ncbi:MAG TPA: protein translocase subunit SecF [Ilumatobacteraceae bacterium]|nr:protein translocase subunit SecF [Ilumatobacteraceae bacterium]
MTLDTSISTSGIGRLFRGQTAFDFHGKRRVGLYVSIVVLVVTIVSMFAQGLNLGLEFEGGEAWEVPASETFGVDEAADVLRANDVSTDSARIQRRSSETVDVVTVQVPVLPREQAAAITADFAEAADVELAEISFSFTSSTWGREITEAAVRALVIFLAVVMLYLSLRLEWRMAVAAIAAMVIDVVVAVGVYTVFQFEVTPATVIAFLTILGYSLYDTIVVFDRIQENEARYASKKGMPYEDIANISMNQVIMRSLLTSLSSILPVVSLLVVGWGILGAVALREFSVALLVGMISGVYSSIFVATPLVVWLKRGAGRKVYRERLLGDDLRAAVMGAGATGRTAGDEKLAWSDDAHGSGGDDGSSERDLVASVPGQSVQPADRLLSHPPRPRKKKRR